MTRQRRTRIAMAETVLKAAFGDTEVLRAEGLEYCSGVGRGDIATEVDVGRHGDGGVAEFDPNAAGFYVRMGARRGQIGRQQLHRR